MAAGVLVVCVGSATRLVEYVQRMPKCYLAEFRLGCRSDTDDRDGVVLELPSAPRPSRAAIESAIPQFVGEILQRPPAYSAIKVQGRRAYALARSGLPVELPARKVTVLGITLRSYDYPSLGLRIECGGGTYVRAIGRDLAESLGTSAVMTELTRTSIGCFHVEHAVPLESLTAETLDERLLPPRLALAGRPVITLDIDQLRRILQGQFLQIPAHGLCGSIAGVNAAGDLMAVLRPHDADQIRPDVVLRSGERP